MKTFTARVTHDEDAWMVEVAEIDRVTQALHLREVEPIARDLIAIMQDVSPDSFALKIVWPETLASAPLCT